MCPPQSSGSPHPAPEASRAVGGSPLRFDLTSKLVVVSSLEMAVVPVTADDVLVVPESVSVGHFEEGALALRLGDLHLYELNPTGSRILGLLDGKRTLREVCELTAAELDAEYETVLSDALEFLGELKEKRVVLGAGEEDAPQGKGPRFEPDVILVRKEAVSAREEGDEGALLYDPDTDSCKILNPVGLDVWKRLDGRRPLSAIASGIAASYDGAEEEAVLQDVLAFAADLVRSGAAKVANDG